MSRYDTLVMAAVLALALVCVTVLTGLGASVPDLFGYTVAGLVGALTGAAAPAVLRKRAAL